MAAVADRAELSKNDAKRALAAFAEIVLEEIGNAQKVRISRTSGGSLGAMATPKGLAHAA